MTGCGTVRARRAIIAVDPSTACAITHDPPLPVDRHELQRRWVMGTGIKVHLVYDRPWWRERGLTGAAVTDGGAVRLTFDVSPPSGAGVMATFLGTPLHGPDLLGVPSDRRQERIVDEFSALFGPKLREPIGYTEQNWAAEPWQTGCPPCLPPGVFGRRHAQLARSVGPLHWAGAETSYLWRGTWTARCVLPNGRAPRYSPRSTDADDGGRTDSLNTALTPRPSWSRAPPRPRPSCHSWPVPCGQSMTSAGRSRPKWRSSLTPTHSPSS